MWMVVGKPIHLSMVPILATKSVFKNREISFKDESKGDKEWSSFDIILFTIRRVLLELEKRYASIVTKLT